MNLEKKTTIELLNGKITKAKGYLSVKYAKEVLNKVWVSEESLNELLKIEILDCRKAILIVPKFKRDMIQRIDEVYLILSKINNLTINELKEEFEGLKK